MNHFNFTYTLVFCAGWIIVSVKLLIILIASLIQLDMSYLNALGVLLGVLISSYLSYVSFKIAESNYGDQSDVY